MEKIEEEGSPVDPDDTDRIRAYSRPGDADRCRYGRNRFYQLCYNRKEWEYDSGKYSRKAEFAIRHASGDVVVRVDAEPSGVSFEDLREIVTTNALSTYPDATLFMEEKRFVNGRKLLCMAIEGTGPNDTTIVQFGYYWSGIPGTILAVAYVHREDFARNKRHIVDLLNGLMIKKW